MESSARQASAAPKIVLVASVLVFALLGALLSRPPRSPEAASSLWLPTANALLNATAASFALAGYAAIRRRRVARHRACMLAAAACSALFLVTYVWHHAQVGSVPYVGPRWARLLYLSILVPHVVLSAALVPLLPLTLWWALSGAVERHRRLARWTLPVWLVVSVTGVLVYAFVYHGNQSFAAR